MKSVELLVPCCNEEENIDAFYTEVDKVFQSIEGYEYSILFVDDGSTDNTLLKSYELVGRLSANKIKYISMSRNFGKESALYVGLSKAMADYIVVMDADLQHSPKLIPDMLRVVTEEGDDSCAARRANRKGESVIKSTFSRTFYYIMNKVTTINLVQGSTDYRLMTRQMAEAPERTTGRATIILIMLFLGGVIIMLLGMIGEYLARIYMEIIFADGGSTDGTLDKFKEFQEKLDITDFIAVIWYNISA